MHNSEAVFPYSTMCSPQSAQDTLLDGVKRSMVGHRVVLPSRSSYIRFSRYKHPNFPPPRLLYTPSFPLPPHARLYQEERGPGRCLYVVGWGHRPFDTQRHGARERQGMPF